MQQEQKKPSNKRVTSRLPSRKSTKLRCYRGIGMGENVALELLDVSETGLRMRVKLDLPVQTALQVSLQGMVHRRPLEREAEVVWCRAASEPGEFLVGARFNKRLTYKEIQDLGYGR